MIKVNGQPLELLEPEILRWKVCWVSISALGWVF
jgi:hypothetical protein